MSASPTHPAASTSSQPYGEALAHMLGRIDSTVAADLDGFPHFADQTTGEWTTSASGDWTGGFWVGQLWLATVCTSNPTYANLAHAWAGRLADRTRSRTIFRGFLFYYGVALGSILANDSAARDLALSGARSLLDDYNRDAGLIPLGAEAEEAHTVGDGETNIDGVSASALLLWASAELDDERLRQAALTHARRHADLCVRADSSVCQSASFAPSSGALLRRYTHKGYGDDSTWSRAQAWAMLGFTLAAVKSGEQDLLQLAQRVSDWWMMHVPPDGVAYWDFDAPVTPTTARDTSATAIAAASLLKLARVLPDEAGAGYRRHAEHTVTALVSDYLTPTAAEPGAPRGILTNGCYNSKIDLAPRNELVWGDYFLLECLGALTGHFDTAQV